MSTLGGTNPAPADLRPLAIMVGAMAGGLVLIGVILALIGGVLETPSTWALLVVAAATLAAWALVLVMPVPRPSDGIPSPAAVSPVVVVRAAVLEAPAILGLVLFFIDRQTLLVYALPAVFSVAGMWLFARPSVVAQRISRGA
ncbi:hypothetical protein SGUI_3188 [Serinicoccus hydrothermalis]|uniref:Uncharacterized protein n=1 Tax=Serinicoccus hydrothermalis TaxID=1758689 RepID=A0A1B1NGN3_9MICO|nr:hypothetical protein [Serinicoccus hydrothermalis]ANS80584.1 hypothetical protein SGUI_3188 [Serinicoccus hydrothermalis]